MNAKQGKGQQSQFEAPLDESLVDKYRIAIRLSLHSSLGFRLSRVKSWDSLPTLYDLIENALISDETLNIIRFFYNAHPNAHPDFWKLKDGVVDSFGIVSGRKEFLQSLSRCVLYPHVNIAANIKTRITTVTKYPPEDVFDLLFLFMRLAQQVEDAKTKDIVWLIMVSHMISLHPSIYSTECPTMWIKHLRNAVAHSQILLVGPMISAYNVAQNGQKNIENDQQKSDNGKKNWEMTIEVNSLRGTLLRMFTDIGDTFEGMSVRAFSRHQYGVEKQVSSITGTEVPQPAAGGSANEGGK